MLWHRYGFKFQKLQLDLFFMIPQVKKKRNILLLEKKWKENRCHYCFDFYRITRCIHISIFCNFILFSYNLDIWLKCKCWHLYSMLSYRCSMGKTYWYWSTIYISWCSKIYYFIYSICIYTKFFNLRMSENMHWLVLHHNLVVLFEWSSALQLY